jgi:hypothetical protein
MRDVIVTVRCSVEWHGDDKLPDQGAISDSVKEAVEEALAHGESRGFNHSLVDSMSIVVTNVDVWALGDK